MSWEEIYGRCVIHLSCIDMAESKLQRSDYGFFLMVGVLDDKLAQPLCVLQDRAILGRFRSPKRDYTMS